MSLLMMGGIETTYREIGYATALEPEFRRTTECREVSVESRTSVDLTEKYTDRNLKIQAPRREVFSARSDAGEIDFAGENGVYSK